MYHDLVETRSYAKPSSKYATSLASVRETRKKTALACALYISRHYGLDVGWRYAEQQWQIMHAESALIVPPRGCLSRGFVEPANGRSHVAASLCSKLTVVALQRGSSFQRSLIPDCCRGGVSACDNFSFRQYPKEPCSHGSALPHPCNFHYQ